MSTQYLSYGIVDGRSHPERDPALRRTVELARESKRRARRRESLRLGRRR